VICIIDEVLYYRSADGFIKRVGEEDENGTLLTPILNRILALLIEKQGEVITKNDFIENVWEKHGLEGSTNTLTQYISHLRKILGKYFDVTQYIVTIPRTGYSLSSELKIQQIEEPKSDPEPDVPVLVLPVTVKKRTNTKWFMILAFALIMLTILSSPMLFENRYLIQSQVVKPLFDHEGCQVSGLSDKSHPMFDVTSIEIAKTILNENAIGCEKDAHFYIAITDGAINKIPGNVMLAKCIESTSNADICVSYQYNRW
jgi:DNA-binding winged helix-turn-helix (wHTH) protein